MTSRRSVVRYCLTAGVVTLGGCGTDSPASGSATESGAATEPGAESTATDASPAVSETETTSVETPSVDASAAEPSTCHTPVKGGGIDVSVANWGSTAERLSVSVYRLTDDESERVFSKAYSLSGEERARSDDVIVDSGRYRVEASTEEGASASFEAVLPDENDAPLHHYSIDVTVTGSGTVEIDVSIADVGTPTAFADGC